MFSNNPGVFPRPADASPAARPRRIFAFISAASLVKLYVRQLLSRFNVRRGASKNITIRSRQSPTRSRCRSPAIGQSFSPKSFETNSARIAWLGCWSFIVSSAPLSPQLDPGIRNVRPHCSFGTIQAPCHFLSRTAFHIAQHQSDRREESAALTRLRDNRDAPNAGVFRSGDSPGHLVWRSSSHDAMLRCCGNDGRIGGYPWSQCAAFCSFFEPTALLELLRRGFRRRRPRRLDLVDAIPD